MKYLNIALSKGRLAELSTGFFGKAGINVEGLMKESRKLIITDEDSKVRFFLVKPSDVPTYVEYGAADIGICGRDTLLEEGRDLYEVIDLGFGACPMCVAGPKELYGKLDQITNKRVATKYPGITRDYFEHVKHESVEIIKLSGSVELAPLVGLSELIVDIVESGKTLKENGLVIFDTICDISARLIVNKVSMKIERVRISNILDSIESSKVEGEYMKIYKLDSLDEYLVSFFSRRAQKNEEIKSIVKSILYDVRESKDKAVRAYTKSFDKVDLESFEVTKEEIADALEVLDNDIKEVINKAASNIEFFHYKEKEESWSFKRNDGSRFGIRAAAVYRAGVYVPGGSAPLPSSVLMNIIPAKVAGVKEVIMCTPPKSDGTIEPVILYAAKIAGADRIFKIGGAQAIAAMAYGTESVPPVDKITGPGNAYVAAAKSLVFGDCGIDMIAGPSEILIIAQDNANYEYIASDLLSQAEHDKMAASILITTNMELAVKVSDKVNELLNHLPRKEIAENSINNNGAIIVAESIIQAADISNKIAPEHLELMFDDVVLTEEFINMFYNAGAIFCGAYSPEPMGDYYCGSNHVLPTGGTARFSSPLGVWDFVKRTSIIKYTKQGFLNDAQEAYKFAMSEGLSAHALSIKKRLENE